MTITLSSVPHMPRRNGGSVKAQVNLGVFCFWGAPLAMTRQSNLAKKEFL